MTEQLNLIDIQFSQKYEPEKAKRLVEQIKHIARTLNGLIQEVSQLSGSTPSSVTSHVLATSAGLGDHHTTSGLEIGEVLKATAPNDAAFGKLTFGEMFGVDPATFAVPEHGEVLTFWDGYYSMMPAMSIFGIGNPGADALLSWNNADEEFSWRLPGTALEISGGYLNVKLDVVTDAVIAALQPSFYPRFLSMGA